MNRPNLLPLLQGADTGAGSLVIAGCEATLDNNLEVDVIVVALQ